MEEDTGKVKLDIRNRIGGLDCGGEVKGKEVVESCWEKVRSGGEEGARGR